jgi:hypothetical protein
VLKFQQEQMARKYAPSVAFCQTCWSASALAAGSIQSCCQGTFCLLLPYQLASYLLHLACLLLPVLLLLLLPLRPFLSAV